VCRRHPGRDQRKQTHWLASSIGDIQKHMFCSVRMTIQLISMITPRHTIKYHIEHLLTATIPILPAAPARDYEPRLLLSPRYRRLHDRVHILCLSHGHRWYTVRCVLFGSTRHSVQDLWKSSCVRIASSLRHSRLSRSCELPCLDLKV